MQLPDIQVASMTPTKEKLFIGLNYKINLK